MSHTIFENDLTQILKTYKTTRETVEKTIDENLLKTSKLKELLTVETDNEKIKRTSLYKDFIKRIRKEVYYSLRTYRPKTTYSASVDSTSVDQANLIDIAQTHISTRERVPHLALFNTYLVEMLANSENILDIGGGLLPFIFPFDRLPTIKNYIWMDKDKEAYETVLAFSKTELKVKPFNYAIGDQPWSFYLQEANKIDAFDAVLMIKLIPVVARQEKELLDLLAKIPAKQIILTASKEAMTKHEDIEARENKTLLKFIELTGRTVVKKFDIENEFGYLIT